MIALRLALGTFKTFRQNKLRTFLAALGIMIGIGAVSAVISVGRSSQEAIAAQIQGLGSNLIYIAPGLIDFSSGQGRQPGSSASTLSLQDVEAIRALGQHGFVTDVSPEIAQAAVVERADKSAIYNVVGAEPVFMTVHDVTLATGRFIEQADLDQKKLVTVLGANASSKLFGDDPTTALGQTVTIRGQAFTVIGVSADSGGFGPVDNDNSVAIPLTTARTILKQEFLSSIYVSVPPGGIDVPGVAEHIRSVLRDKHGITNQKDADFTVLTQDDILSVVGTVTGYLTTAVSAIAGISLLVGGVGILNTMLFTVVQRTREIGLRKALGATRGQILWQFLVESMLLSLLGGLLGLALSFAILSVARYFLDFPIWLSWSAVGISAAVSIGIGVLFGIAPARRAAKLDPIESLRHE